MADTLGLGPSFARSEGSTPSARTLTRRTVVTPATSDTPVRDAVPMADTLTNECPDDRRETIRMRHLPTIADRVGFSM